MFQNNLNLDELYKIPWTTYNNPNGWIEPTTYCQLACPGCYRGLALPNPIRFNEDLTSQKKQIDRLIELRKIKILSIAGGEPLLYPKLNDIIAYASSKGLKSRLVSNGAALTEERLQTLKQLGVTEIAIHVAQYQKRANFKTEKTINLLREKYAQIFRNVKGIELNFIMYVSKNNFSQLPNVINFCQQNADVVNRVIFTFYRDVLFKKKPDTSTYLPLNKLVNLIQKEYQAQPCSYLGKTLDSKNPSWLFFAPILLGGKTIGYADAKTAEKFHNQSDNSSYNSFPSDINLTGLVKTLSSISLTTARKISTGYIKHIIKNPKNISKLPRTQIVILLNTPTPTKKGWDLCDGCPNAMLFKGKLVPSCLLERMKLGEQINL